MDYFYSVMSMPLVTSQLDFQGRVFNRHTLRVQKVYMQFRHSSGAQRTETKSDSTDALHPFFKYLKFSTLR